MFINSFCIISLIIISTIISFLIIVSILEIFIRLFIFLKYNFLYEKVSRFDFLDPEYHSYIKWTDTWEKPMFYYYPTGMRLHNIKNPLPKVENNSFGFRCDEFEKILKLNREVRKIVLVGGSAAWGFGASSNKKTIAGCLEKKLNENSSFKYKVINLSIVNQTQTQDLQILMWLLPILKPNLVIHYGGWNELISSSTIEAKHMLKYEMIPINEMLDWEPIKVGSNSKKTLIKSFLTLISQKLILGEKISNFLNKKNNIFLKRSLKKNVKLLSKIFIANMIRMKKLSESYDCQFLQVVQPHIFRKLYPSPAEKKVIELYEEHRRLIGNKKDIAFLKNINYFEEVKKEINARKINVNLLSLVVLFLKVIKEYFYSLVHCRDAGYAKIALKIYELLYKKKVKI